MKGWWDARKNLIFFRSLAHYHPFVSYASKDSQPFPATHWYLYPLCSFVRKCSMKTIEHDGSHTSHPTCRDGELQRSYLTPTYEHLGCQHKILFPIFRLVCKRKPVYRSLNLEQKKWLSIQNYVFRTKFKRNSPQRTTKILEQIHVNHMKGIFAVMLCNSLTLDWAQSHCVCASTTCGPSGSEALISRCKFN